MYRPPSEGGSNSLLVRFTRNCPWNRCAFCAMYKTRKFQIRNIDEIKADIDAMAAMRDELLNLSPKKWIPSQGTSQGISRRAAVEIINKHPELNGHPGFSMLFNFLISGARTAFLQDGNTVIMKTEDLVAALIYLRRTFPTIARVTTYARSKTIAKKKLSELEAIRAAGLDRLHVGLETGDDKLLARIAKGVSGQDHIKAGRKAVEAGFQLSEYWMPGLGGKAFWENHARHTADVLNAINPHYIRSRPFRPIPSTPMHDDFQAGSLQLLAPEEQLRELKLTIENLDVTSRVCFDHDGNDWRDNRGQLLFSHNYEGYQFPREKANVLALIEKGLCA